MKPHSWDMLPEELAAVRPLGLVGYPTTGDGSCLFHALSDQLYGNEGSSQWIRLFAVEFMRQRAGYFMQTPDGETDFGDNLVEYHKYCDDMQALDAEGHYWEITACAAVFHVNVEVHQLGQDVLTFTPSMARNEGEDLGPVRGTARVWFHGTSRQHYSSLRRSDWERVGHRGIFQDVDFRGSLRELWEAGLKDLFEGGLRERFEGRDTTAPTPRTSRRKSPVAESPTQQQRPISISSSASGSRRKSPSVVRSLSRQEEPKMITPSPRRSSRNSPEAQTSTRQERPPSMSPPATCSRGKSHEAQTSTQQQGPTSTSPPTGRKLIEVRIPPRQERSRSRHRTPPPPPTHSKSSSPTAPPPTPKKGKKGRSKRPAKNRFAKKRGAKDSGVKKPVNESPKAKITRRNYLLRQLEIDENVERDVVSYVRVTRSGTKL